MKKKSKHILNFNKNNWKTSKLGDYIREVNETSKNPSEEGLNCIVGLEHIDSGTIHLKRSAELNNTTTFTKVFRKGQILFGRRRAYLKKAAQANFDGICSGDITVMEAKEGLLPELLPFLIHNDRFFDFAIKNSAGSLSPRVKFKDLAEYEFLLPPKEEQTKLAKLLWAADNVVEKDKELLEKLEVVNLIENKYFFNKRNGKQTNLSELSSIIMGQSPPGESYNETGIGKPFLQGNAEFGETHPISYKFTTDAKKIAPTNSILISVRAPVGDLNISDKEYCIGRGLAAIVVQENNLREYLYEFLYYSRYELEKKSSGSTFKSINKDILESLPIYLPNNEEIKNSVKVFNHMKKNKNNIQSKLHSSQALLKVLINEIFGG